LRSFPAVPAGWLDPALAAKWAKVREVRRVVTGALEVERAAKRIGSSLQAHPAVHIERAEPREAVGAVDFADVAITSGITIADAPAPADAFRLPEVTGVAVVAAPAAGEKCERCWKVLPEVGASAGAPDTCARCADAVQHLGAAAQ